VKQLYDRQADPEGGDHLRQGLPAHPQEHEAVHQRPRPMVINSEMQTDSQ